MPALNFVVSRGLVHAGAAALLAAAWAGVAHAARPMITDDARVVDDKSCQLETWVQRNKKSTEFWALPACNFTGSLELTLGGAATRADGRQQSSAVVMQGKQLIKPLETNGWGMAVALGTARDPHDGPGRDWYAYVPTSFSFKDDRVVLHTNVGWLREQGVHRNRLTWGVGSETHLQGNTWLIAETYGRGQGKPFYQLGLRHWIVPNRVQMDATYGNRFDGQGERWFSIGLRLLSLPFLP